MWHRELRAWMQGSHESNGRRYINVVVTRLRDMVIEGLLQPGSRIHEGQTRGTARRVPHSATRSAQGVGDGGSGRTCSGARCHGVRALTAKDVQDMLSVLSVLEQLAGTLTCQNASDADIRDVRQLHDEMMAFYRSGDRLQYFKKISKSTRR